MILLIDKISLASWYRNCISNSLHLITMVWPSNWCRILSTNPVSWSTNPVSWYFHNISWYFHDIPWYSIQMLPNQSRLFFMCIYCIYLRDYNISNDELGDRVIYFSEKARILITGDTCLQLLMSCEHVKAYNCSRFFWQILQKVMLFGYAGICMDMGWISIPFPYSKKKSSITNQWYCVHVSWSSCLTHITSGIADLMQTFPNPQKRGLMNLSHLLVILWWWKGFHRYPWLSMPISMQISMAIPWRLAPTFTAISRFGA